MPPRPSPERVETPHGTVFLFEIGEGAELEAALARLPVAEREHAGRLGEIRRRDFVIGRAALLAALAAAAAGGGGGEVAILPDERGAPVLPAGWTGSVSHKGALAAAIVAPAGGGWVGIDVERAAPPRVDIARRILTPREEARLPDRGRAVTLRFAIKEAIYKAVAPHLRRYVGFTEVELELEGEGVSECGGSGAGAGACTVAHALPLAIEAAWREHAGYWLATARARLR